MNRDVGRYLAPLLAVALFAFVLVQTLHALQDSGVWHFGVRKAYVPPADPLGELDGLVARAQGGTFEGASRDPFGYGAVAQATGPLQPVVRRPAVPPPPQLPVLTAIVFDAEPNAQLRWQGRVYTVREGSLFDDFKVVGITREQVVLTHGADSIVLKRKTQGE